MMDLPDAVLDGGEVMLLPELVVGVTPRMRIMGAAKPSSYKTQFLSMQGSIT
jgi:hypothetical protein